VHGCRVTSWFVLLRVAQVHDDPPVYTVEGFLTPDECAGEGSWSGDGLLSPVRACHSTTRPHCDPAHVRVQCCKPRASRG
jgi:hypothetical protein